MSDGTDVVVVGAGQAGLAVSHELARAGVSHTVLERGRIGQTWRGRWESFCLVTPNWSLRLPGHHYDADDPDGYLLRDEVVAYLERYAHRFDAPVREGVEVTSLERGRDGGLALETTAGSLSARAVVVCTGAYQRPHRPAGAATLPPDLLQIDVEDYRTPGALPSGPVLVVGSGQSGCQIAEELHESGREVFLACGRAPWLPRRFGGHDLVWWALETGFLDAPASSLPDPAALLAANLLATGRDGGATSTSARCGGRASPCSGTSSAPRVAARGSRRTSARAWHGATRATGSSWTSHASSRPSAGCRRRGSPSRSPSATMSRTGST